MKKRFVPMWNVITDKWKKSYAWLIPFILLLVVLIANCITKFRMSEICGDESFSDMLGSIITSMSIIISIFGFLMPSLISAKNDKMVKYFIENADMNEFTKKIKAVIRSGMVGIALSIVLYVNKKIFPIIQSILLYSLLVIGTNFACSSYRFISIIISLLLKEKKDLSDKKCLNEMPEEKIQQLDSKIEHF